MLQVHSTCFGCQPHPSSGEHKTLTTASCIGHIFVQLPSSNVAKLAKLATLEEGSCKQKCNCSLWYWSYFLCSYLPPTWTSWPRWRKVAVNKTVTAALGTGHIFVQLPPSNVAKLAKLVTLEEGRCKQNCNCSLRYWSYFLCSYLPPTWPSWPSWLRWRKVAVNKTVTAASGTGHIFCAPTSLQRDQVGQVGHIGGRQL